MLTSFWTGLGDKLTERWIGVTAIPAFAFWIGGLLAWTVSPGPLSSLSRGPRDRLLKWVTDLQQLSPVIQGAVLLGLLLGIVASGVVVQRLSLPVMRLLEGYWPRRLNKVRRRLVKRRSVRLELMSNRLRELASVEPAVRTQDELIEYVRLDQRRHRVPARREQRMPTRLGDVLRASEGRPSDRYGLDTVVCWPRLWLVLPEDVKKELTDARARLDASAQLWTWAGLFLVWTLWAWWALPVGLLVQFYAYSSLVSAAGVYGDLMEGAFDLHRWDLYKALHWPPPANPAEEPQSGREITEYLWRGSDHKSPSFKA